MSKKTTSLLRYVIESVAGEALLAVSGCLTAERRGEGRCEATVEIKKGTFARKYLFLEFLAPRAGLEPATCGLTVRRSTD